MEAFVRSIPTAATHPFAFAAYAIAAVLFAIAGAKLSLTQLLLAKLALIPEADRRGVVQQATEVVLPTEISAEQWLRHNRQRWAFLLLGSLLIVLFAVATIALVNPAAAQIESVNDTTKRTAEETQTAVEDGTTKTAKKIDESTSVIVSTVEDSALANLEAMFPLAVRIDRDVDGTIAHLNGERMQRVVSFDKNMAPMKLYWGDRFHYFVFSNRGIRPSASEPVFLEVKSRNRTVRLPLNLDPHSEQELRIPGSTPDPMDAYLINDARLTGVSLKITVYSADRERGRAEFQRALANTTLQSAARRTYLEVAEDGARLRATPSEHGLILRTVRQGSYVRVKNRTDDGDWAEIRLPEGREGWIKARLLRPIAT